MLKTLYGYLLNILKKLVYSLLFASRNPKLMDAKNQYIYTDEHLKFVHLLECMNYLKVAGHENKIHQVYYEFGSHSGRTFFATVNGVNIGFKVEEWKNYSTFGKFFFVTSTPY